MVVALGASDLAPPVGAQVELVAIVADADSASAAVRWEGVDRADGAQAVVSARAAGPLRVCADERCVTLEVGGLSATCADGTAPREGACPAQPLEHAAVVPRLEVDACFDDAWPRVVAGVVLGCTGGGRVDTVVDPATAERWTLPTGARTPVVDGARVLLPGPAPAWVDVLTRAHTPVAATRDAGEAWGAAAGGWVLAAADRLRTEAGDRWAAQPLPDAGPVGAGGLVLWTERRCAGGACDDEVWGRVAGRSFVVAGGAGDQRRPVVSGDRVAWFDDHDVVVFDLATGERRRWRAEAGFRGPLALDARRACWEDRAVLKAGAGRVRIRCSDGLEVADDDEDLLAPALGGGWLSWHQGDQVYAARVDR